jgi:1,4-dihydroxy-2-naphthoate octaprenyltransferase
MYMMTEWLASAILVVMLFAVVVSLVTYTKSCLVGILMPLPLSIRNLDKLYQNHAKIIIAKPSAKNVTQACN